MANKVDFLLIGGGLASAVTAQNMRTEGEMGTITILCGENYFPYHRAHLSRDFLLDAVQKEGLEIFKQGDCKKKRFDVLIGTKAISVDPKKKIVTTDKAGQIEYNKLLIATGCVPKKLNVPGSDLACIYYLRTLEDNNKLSEKIKNSKSVIIVGGTYLAIELASTFSKLGLKVTCIAKEFNFFDKELSPEIRKLLTDHGVEVIIGDPVKEFRGEGGNAHSVVTDSGKSYACDFVAVAVGFEPDLAFLQGSNIDVDNGIIVNSSLQTNQKDVYAAGDVANFYDLIYETRHRIESWDNAIKQGKIAALNMMGQQHSYRTISYFFFYAFGDSLMFLGDTTDTDKTIIRGTRTDKTFGVLYLKDEVLRAAFFLGRPTTEIKAAESLIVNRVNLKDLMKKITDLNFPLEKIANQNVLALQGGGALGAFECGVVKALEEAGIYADIVAGVSIGAFNAAIIASNPRNAAKALDAFWDELKYYMPDMLDEDYRRALSSWHTITWGLSKFFYPKWYLQFVNPADIPWTSFYDPTPIKKLLNKYVDFASLRKSPVRLIVMAVNVETAQLEVFDSYTNDITADHILASGSLPPGFPWTEINGKYYWDGGIVSNTPLDSVIDIAGSTGKHVYVVDLYPTNRVLPKNLLEVIARKDEILFTEKIKRNMRTREVVENYKKIVEFMMGLLDPEAADQVRQIPLYIQTVGDPGVLSLTRITRELKQNDVDARDSDFSSKTIDDHKSKGYKAAKKAIKGTHPK